MRALVKDVTSTDQSVFEMERWDENPAQADSPALHDHVACREETEMLRARVRQLANELERSRKNEAVFRSLAEESCHPVCLAEATGTISFANESFCNLFSPEEGEVVGKDLFQLLPEAKREMARQEFECLKPECPSGGSVFPLFRPQESGLWERWRMSALFDASGNRVGFRLQGQDITATKKLQDLSGSMEKIFENTPLGVVYSENMRVERVNTALCGLLGYRENELLGRIMPFDSVSVVKKRLPGFIKAFKGGENGYFETKLRRKDGAVIDCFVLVVPVRSETAGMAHYTFVKDISEHMELKRQALRTDLVVTRSPLVLFQGRFVRGIPLDYVSENISQFGYSSDDLLASGTKLNSLIHPDDLAVMRKESERDDRFGNLAREHLYRLKTADGRYRWVRERSQVIPAKGPEPDSVAGILLDVTDQKQAETEVRNSHERLEAQVARLEKTWEQTIGLLAAVTELRDPYTMGHQRRVAHLSGAIAGEMGLTEAEIQEIVRAALVHDIGKIHIPSEFLCKPGKLSPQEFGIIREHARTGAELLDTIELPWPLASIVAGHHERLDGSGYPEGLKGEEILLASRILAVADVVEAMASHRPYRPALGIEKALEEIQVNSGRLYDPEAVSACRRLFREKGYALPCGS